MAPSRRPAGAPVWARSSVTSTASSSVSARMTPSSPASASKASTLPASEPVCAMAALRPASDWPSLTATIALPAARASRQAAANFCRVRDRLHIDDDDLELGLVGEEGHVVRHRQAGFVAAGDQIFGTDAALLERRIDEDHHAAALPDQRDRAGAHRQRPVLGQRHQPALGADIAHAVGARYAEAGFRDHGRELAAERRRPRCRRLRRSRPRTPWRCARPRPPRCAASRRRRPPEPAPPGDRAPPAAT